MSQQSSPAFSYENLFRVVGNPYIVFDVDSPKFTIIDENEEHAKVGMVKRKDVIGKPLLEAFPDTSEEYLKTGRSELADSLQRVLDTGKPDSMSGFNYDLKDENGVLMTKFWEVTHHPIIENGKVVAIYQQTKDITDTVSVQKELTIAQDQLEQALAYSEVGTWIWDIKKDIVLADRNLAKMFGLGNGTEQIEVPLNSLTKAIHPDDAERVGNEISQAVNGKSPSFESEYRTYDYDGDIRWLLARGHIEYDASGEAIRFPGIVVDITSRKITENNLHILAKTNTQFPAGLGYRQTLEAIVSIIVPNVADWCAIEILEDGKIEQVAVAHSDPEKVKWAKELTEKRGPVDINAPSGSPWVIRTGKVEYIPSVTEDMLEKAAKNKKELKILKDLNFCSVITAPLKIDGKTIGAISFVSTDSRRHYDEDDLEIAVALANRASLAVYNANLFQNAKNEINERKKLQAELEKFNSVLEDRVKKRTLQLEKTNEGLKDEIALRHKLENQRLQHYIDLNKTKDEFISLASHQLRTPATGVKQYLGMVLEGLVGDVTETQQALLQKAYQSNERQLTIVSDLLKVAQIDSGKMRLRPKATDVSEIVEDVIKEQEDTYAMRRQTIDFLVPSFGAIAYIDADKIRMVLENMIDNASKYSDPGKAIKVSMKEEGSMIVVSVKDHGVGIGPKDIDKLFQKFNRIHNHLSNHVGGTGLGLYWAKKVVDLHGGIIKVTSVLGKGSTFSVYLPKKEKSPVETVKIGAVYENET